MIKWVKAIRSVDLFFAFLLNDEEFSFMYRVVLVDDEKYSLVDIIHSFPWAKYHCEVVATYTNPVEALSAIGAIEPDFLFTDIRMPVMDGLELIEKVKKMALKTKFVIVSSYSDFAYMQQAIQKGVVDYCLKPVDENVANELLHRLVHGKTGDYAEESPVMVGQDPLFRQITAHIQANLHNNLSLTDIANQFHISVSTCGHVFTQMNTTFSAYIFKQRMEYAKRLLETTDYSISQIAIFCGYADYGYFNKQFKRMFDVPPATYRNNHKGKNE